MKMKITPINFIIKIHTKCSVQLNQTYYTSINLIITYIFTPFYIFWYFPLPFLTIGL